MPSAKTESHALHCAGQDWNHCPRDVPRFWCRVHAWGWGTGNWNQGYAWLPQQLNPLFHDLALVLQAPTYPQPQTMLLQLATCSRGSYRVGSFVFCVFYRSRVFPNNSRFLKAAFANSIGLTTILTSFSPPLSHRPPISLDSWGIIKLP